MRALALLTLLPVTAFAQDVDCADWPKESTQLVMNICSGREATEADAELNRLWTEARKVAKEREASLRAGKWVRPLGADQTGPWQALLAAQRGWIAYKDAHCTAVSLKVFGGSMAPLVHNGCQTKLARARISELRDFIDERP